MAKNLSKTEIIDRANQWMNTEVDFKKEMTVLENSFEEHDYCYSFKWCVKGEENIIYEFPQFVGIGRLLISKDGNYVDFEGSSPGIDWINNFEVEVRGLEEYFYLEIFYEKKYISKLKAALSCSTPELLKMVNEESKIILERTKSGWNDFPLELEDIKRDLINSGIKCEIEIKTRKKGIE